jgi:AcrR family transcriptional regulator
MSARIEERSGELRERILDATLQVIRERGIARARTSTIAQAAGCAEGTIYRYFVDKPTLLREAVRRRLPDGVVLPGLSERVGTRTVRVNVLEVTCAALDFYRRLVPLAAGIFADADLWADRLALAERGDLGAQRGEDSLAAYLRAEQQLGRIRPDVDADAIARLLLNACLGEGFLDALGDRRPDDADEEGFARTLVDLVARELEPR